MLRQVFINIIKNAVEAKASKISIEAEETKLLDTKSIINIYISNNGTPIAPEAISTIFVPFFTTKRSGTGVGLSVCQQIMAKLEGDITLSDVPKNSYITSFKLSLPYRGHSTPFVL